jgi:hypothetical protein
LREARIHLQPPSDNQMIPKGQLALIIAATLLMLLALGSRSDPPSKPVKVVNVASPAPSMTLKEFVDRAHGYRNDKLKSDDPRAYRFGVRLLMDNDTAPFWMAIPMLEAGVAASDFNELMFKLGHFPDPHEETWVRMVLKRHCKNNELMIDIGSNTGYYSLLAMAFGCRTKTVDGARDALNYFAMSVAMNGWEKRSKIFDRVVSSDTKVSFNGWTAMTEVQPEPTKDNSAYSTFSQDSITMDELVGGDEVVYMKVDVECYESVVFPSGYESIKSGKIKNLLFEFFYRCNDRDLLPAYREKVLEPLLKAGYGCALAGRPDVDFKLDNLDHWFTQFATRGAMGCAATSLNCGYNIVCSLEGLHIVQ